jgi:hypothetical protein
VFSPCGPLTKHWVKGHQLENIDRFEAKLGGDPFRGLIADEAKMYLPEMEQRKGSTPFLIERIMADASSICASSWAGIFILLPNCLFAFHNDCACNQRKRRLRRSQAANPLDLQGDFANSFARKMISAVRCLRKSGMMPDLPNPQGVCPGKISRADYFPSTRPRR